MPFRAHAQVRIARIEMDINIKAFIHLRGKYIYSIIYRLIYFPSVRLLIS